MNRRGSRLSRVGTAAVSVAIAALIVHFARGPRTLRHPVSDASVDQLSEALRENPENSTARLALASAYAKQGWKEEARKQFELTAKSSKDTLREAYLGLSALEEAAGNRVEAKKFAEAAGKVQGP